jgi:hypothetical protein
MKYSKSSRRMFLQGSGQFLLAIPFLPSMLPRAAWGQSPTVMKRFITIMTNFDLGHNANWIPNMNPNNFRNIPAPANLDPRGFRWQQLRDFAPNGGTPLAPIYGTAFNSYLNRMNIVRGLDFSYRYGHGVAQNLGSIQRNPLHSSTSGMQRIASIDYVLSQNSRVNPTRRAPTLIGNRFREGDGLTVNDAQGGNAGQNPIDRFNDLYTSLFTNVPETGSDPVTITTPPHPRRDILNRVMEDYQRLRGHRNISRDDRQALTAAMDRFSDIHRRLPNGSTMTQTRSCQHRQMESANGSISGRVGEDLQANRLLVDMVTAAIMCNVNNIYTITLRTPFTRAVSGMPGFFSSFPDRDFHQSVSHKPWNRAPDGQYVWQWMANYQARIAQGFIAPLIASLEGITDPSNGESLLHNSLLFASWESGQVHSHRSAPAILAGNAGGALSSGHYLDYSDRTTPERGVDGGGDNGRPRFNNDPSSLSFSNNYQGVSYNRLLVTILQAMGMQPSEYEDRNLNRRYHNRNDIGDQNRGLTSIGGYGHAGNTVNRNDNASAIAGFDLRQFGNPLPFV